MNDQPEIVGAQGTSSSSDTVDTTKVTSEVEPSEAKITASETEETNEDEQQPAVLKSRRLISCDCLGEIVEVEERYLYQCGFFREMFSNLLMETLGDVGTLPLQVEAEMMRKIIQWLEHHHGRPELVVKNTELTKERVWFTMDEFEKKFLDIPPRELLAYCHACNFLDLKSLYLMSAQAVAGQLRAAGTPEKIRTLLDLPDDLSAVEKAEIERENIASVKEKICDLKDLPVERQTLSYDGKTCRDDQLISELNIGADQHILVEVIVEPHDAAVVESAEPSTSSNTSANNNEGTEAGDEKREKATRRKNSEESLDYLRDDPAFRELRDMVRQNQELLPQILRQLEQYQPEIVADIRANPAAFMAMVQQEDAVPTNVGLINEFVNGTTGAIPNSADADDRRAILRLVNMGFPQDLVVEAFFACDKKEEYAINYILQRINDGDF